MGRERGVIGLESKWCPKLPKMIIIDTTPLDSDVAAVFVGGNEASSGTWQQLTRSKRTS